MKLSSIALLLVGILILGALLYPPISGGPRDGLKARAKNDVWQLVVAQRAYTQEYGEPPLGSENVVLRILLGSNPRGIVFIEVDPKRTTKDGFFLDPWKQPYAFGSSPSRYSWAYSYGKNKIDEGGHGDDVNSWN